MSIILTRSLSIPDEIRPDVANVVLRTWGQSQFKEDDLKYLFEVYNRFLAPADSPENINCGGCRTKVVGWLRTAVTEWKENGIINDGTNTPKSGRDREEADPRPSEH